MKRGNGALLAQPQHGVVSAVDPVRNTVRVLLQPDGVETGDIPAPALAAGTLRIAIPLEVGTQVTLKPIGGDAEQFVVSTVLFDAVMTPPISPQTGQPAQPGEFLVVTGQQGAPPADGSAPQGAAADGGWWHVTPGGLFAGAGNCRLALRNGQAVLSVAGCTATLSPDGVTVSGGDVKADGISLKTHVHGGVQGGSSLTGVPQE